MASQNTDSGFVEIPHTADWSIRVWGQDYRGLLLSAMGGLYSLADTVLEAGDRQMIPIDLHAQDEESLLVEFLNELLFFSEQRGIGFDGYDEVRIEKEGAGLALHGRFKGAAIAQQRKEIKAVTYHGLKVVHLDNRVEATLVLDV
jgi:SHS2 domain-containing protein